MSSALAIIVLATAMALLTALLAMWNDLSLRPPAGFQRGGEVLTIAQNDGDQRRTGLSRALIERIDEEGATVASIAGVQWMRHLLDRGDEQEPVDTELVTARYFEVLAPRLQLGRAFGPEDHQPDAEPVAILSHAFWQNEFGGRPDVLGRTLRVLSWFADQEWQDYRIVGVLAPQVRGTFYPDTPGDTAIWMPFEQAARALDPADVGAGALFGVARPNGSSAAAVRAELRGRYGDSDEPGIGNVSGLRYDVAEGLVRDFQRHRDVLRQVRLFLAGAVLLALVAACNISLYLLSRAPGRRRELAIRLSVGAPLRRVARQLITESGLLVAVATLLGLLASLWLAAAISDMAFLREARWRDLTPFDWRVLAMVAAVMLVLTALVTLAPVAGLRRMGISASSASVTARAGMGQRLAGTAQVAVAMVIGGAALAFLWYMMELASRDRGFSAHGVYAVQHASDFADVPQVQDEDALLDLLLTERAHRRDVIRALPGIEGVAFGTSVPGRLRVAMRMSLPDPDTPDDSFQVAAFLADPGYFELIGASLRAGRLYAESDRSHVVINEQLARRLWNTTNVVGEILSVPVGPDGRQWEVVGVVRDIVYTHPAEEIEPAAYLPIASQAAMFATDQVLIESSLSAAELRGALQERIDAGELRLRIASIDPIEALWSSAIAPDRARTALTVASALLVTILAGFGFYGTQRFLVAAGRREYAIRAAVGAGPRTLGRVVLARGLLLGAPGLALGAPLAFIAVAWMRGEFVSYSVSPAVVTLAVTAFIAALLLAASLGPARQARNTQPAPLLRED